MQKGEGLFQTKVNEQGHGKGCVVERAPRHHGMISEQTMDEPGPGHGAEEEEVGFMQNGAQEGYMDDDEIQPFVEEFEMRIRQIRGQDPRKARNLVHLVMNQVVKGLRSKLPSLRQVSRSLQAVVVNVWPELEPLVNVHADSHGSWTTKFWKRVRTACRKCSRAYRKRKWCLVRPSRLQKEKGKEMTYLCARRMTAMNREEMQEKRWTWSALCSEPRPRGEGNTGPGANGSGTGMRVREDDDRKAIGNGEGTEARQGQGRAKAREASHPAPLRYGSPGRAEEPQEEESRWKW